jgi:hypothetical protein
LERCVLLSVRTSRCGIDSDGTILPLHITEAARAATASYPIRAIVANPVRLHDC